MKLLGKFSGMIYDDSKDMEECGVIISDEQAKDEKFISDHHVKDLLDCVLCFGCPKSTAYGCLGGPKQVNVIDKFEGENFFLSNFYEAPVSYNGIDYDNSEAAFHAQKCVERAHEFSHLTPKEAKKLGRSVELRNDWEEVKDDIMHDIVKNKFTQNKNLENMLLSTGEAILVEGNWWHDTYWGMCNGKGKNKLGQILMEVRSEIRKGVK